MDPTADGAPERRARLLIVDDDTELREVLAGIFRRQYEVDAVGDVDAALDLLKSHVRYDVVLCDLVLPIRGGAELYQIIRVLDPELAERIVFVTGAASDAYVGHFLSEVPNARLFKPCHPRELQDLVAQSLRAPRGG